MRLLRLLFVCLVVSGIGLRRVEASPSFDCDRVIEGSVEKLICDDPELSALDRRLSEVFEAALVKEKSNPHPVLLSIQRGWIKGRNECWKSPELRLCVEQYYERRIAELEAQYRLASPSQIRAYVCGDSAADEIVVSFFDTKPKIVIAERGDRTFRLFETGEESKYVGSNETIQFDADTLQATLAFEAPALHCRLPR